MNRTYFAALLALALASPALAQTAAPSTSVSIPYGDIISYVGSIVLPLFGVAFAWLIRRLPAQIGQILTTMQAEQLFQKAIAYGLNAVEGATAGKALSVNVGNAVLAEALNYVLQHAPQWLVSWLGGPDAIAQKIIARLNLEPAAGVTAINGTPVIASSTPAPAASPVAAPATAPVLQTLTPAPAA